VRRIRKGKEPQSWAEYHLSTPGARYEDAPKDELRRSLLSEQGHLCCYCMRRIDEATMRIEHRLPRDEHPGEQFAYRNLHAACPGGEGREEGMQHCDVSKRNTEISLDPADAARDVEQLLRYSSSGAIDADDDKLRHDVAVTLNLNLHWLKEARKAKLDGFRVGFERKHKKSWSRDAMERELKRWADLSPGGRFDPYSGVVVSYLRKRLRQAALR
jgi:uncharacterized protein (TIGR02646 family)